MRDPAPSTTKAAKSTGEPPSRRHFASERQRRWRARQRDGVIMVSVPVKNGMIETLLDLRYLLEHESEDRREIGKGIAAALASIRK